MTSSAKIAVLDVGSNSVRLLVAQIRDGQVFPLHTEKITSRLLAGFDGQSLAEDAVSRTASAIESLSDRARRMGATRILAFGTSAVRDGQNRDALIRRAADKGVRLLVLDGLQEAALAYAGAAPNGRCCVIDIGGGSTELLAGEDGCVAASCSARIGALRLCEKLGSHADARALLCEAKETLAPCWAQIASCPCDTFTGVGGTVTALAALELGLSRYDSARIQNFVLRAERVRDWLRRLTALMPEDRRHLPGLSPERADILPAGAAILSAFFELSGAPSLIVSDRDNLIGFIKRYVVDRETV